MGLPGPTTISPSRVGSGSLRWLWTSTATSQLEQGLQKLYDDLEAPLIKVLVDMEYEGINLNGDFLLEYSKEISKEIEELEKKIYEEAGVRFNIASPKQVGEILFDKMKIPYRWRKTKTGQYSTNEEKLSELAAGYPFVEEILKYRGLTKLQSKKRFTTFMIGSQANPKKIEHKTTVAKLQ